MQAVRFGILFFLAGIAGVCPAFPQDRSPNGSNPVRQAVGADGQPSRSVRQASDNQAVGKQPDASSRRSGSGLLGTLFGGGQARGNTASNTESKVVTTGLFSRFGGGRQSDDDGRRVIEPAPQTVEPDWTGVPFHSAKGVAAAKNNRPLSDPSDPSNRNRVLAQQASPSQNQTAQSDSRKPSPNVPVPPAEGAYLGNSSSYNSTAQAARSTRVASRPGTGTTASSPSTSLQATPGTGNALETSTFEPLSSTDSSRRSRRRTLSPLEVEAQLQNDAGATYSSDRLATAPTNAPGITTASKVADDTAGEPRVNRRSLPSSGGTSSAASGTTSTPPSLADDTQPNTSDYAAGQTMSSSSTQTPVNTANASSRRNPSPTQPRETPSFDAQIARQSPANTASVPQTSGTQSPASQPSVPQQTASQPADAWKPASSQFAQTTSSSAVPNEPIASEAVAGPWQNAIPKTATNSGQGAANQTPTLNAPSSQGQVAGSQPAVNGLNSTIQQPASGVANNAAASNNPATVNSGTGLIPSASSQQNATSQQNTTAQQNIASQQAAVGQSSVVNETLGVRPSAQASGVPASVSTAVAVNSNTHNIVGEIPGLRVITMGPAEIPVRKSITYKVVIENMGNIDAPGAMVQIKLPVWVTIDGQQPSRGEVGREDDATMRHLLWLVQGLPAGSREEITLMISATEAKEFDVDTEWAVMPQSSVAHVMVREPKLDILIEGPDQVVYGESATYMVRVMNPGSGPADTVVFTLSPNSATPQSQRIGMIPPGKDAQFEVELTARDMEDLQIHGLASGALNLKAEKVKTIQVIQAELEAVITGPTLKYQDADAVYNLQLSNVGLAGCKNVQAVLMLPQGVVYQGGLDGATVNGNRLTWTIAEVPATGTMDYSVSCKMTQTGKQSFSFACEGSARGATSVDFVTQVDALADLVLTINDPPAPAPVGKEVVYEIVVRNRGSKAADEVSVLAQFGVDIEPIRIEGAEGEIVPGQVKFAPIPRIESGQQVVLKVFAKAEREGHHRFCTEVSCGDTLLIAEEATRYLEMVGQRVSRKSGDSIQE